LGECYGEGIFEGLPGYCRYNECIYPFAEGCTNNGPFDPCCNFLAPRCCVSLTAPGVKPPYTIRPPLSPHEGCCEWEINTAIGCVPVRNSTEFVAFILRWALGVGGGISFLLIVYSGFLYMSSSGNSEKLVSAKESFTAGVSGLLLLIFSVFILEFVIVRIFNFPTLSLSAPTGACKKVPIPTPIPTQAYPTQAYPTPTSTPEQCIYNLNVADSVNASDWSVQFNLQVGDFTYGDRFGENDTILSLPSYLLGNCWIRTANDSKTYHNDPLVTFNFNVEGDAYVYVTHDVRVARASWLSTSNGWVQMAENVLTNEPGFPKIRTFTLWRKAYSAGETVSLGQNSPDTTNNQSMYLVVVTPQVDPPPATNTPVPPATNTPVPPATNTPVPPATNTPVPPATNTATPTPLPACIYNIAVYDSLNASDWSFQNNLQEGDYTYGDRFVEKDVIFSLPSYLLGNCWIRTANDSKYFQNDPLVTFNFWLSGQDAYIYVTHDVRVGNAPWLSTGNGWEQMPNADNVITSEPNFPAFRTFSLWRKAYSAGDTVSIGPNSSSTTGNQSMYIIVVVPR
jgi:hypothetical protein